jgi:glycosyltransferase involved in cell wall biosynthesis
MRVCLCISYFPPVRGGAEHQAARLAAGLVRAGDEVTVVTRSLPGAPSRETWQGVRVHRAIRPGRTGVLFGAGYCLSLLGFLLRPGRRFDVVQATGVHLGAYVSCGLRNRLGYRVVVRPTGLGPDGDLASLDRMPFWPLWRAGDAPTRRHILHTIRGADAFVALNREMAAELTAHGFPGDRIVRIPNGVPIEEPVAETEERRQARARLGLPEGPLLLFVGRLNRHKGARDLVRALSALSGTHPNATLALLGGGPLREELSALAESLGVGPRVYLLGEREPGPYLRVADVFALPTRGEGMSNALLEAMGAGLACVTTRVTGNVEVVAGGETGLLVEPGDPAALAEAIGSLLADPAARLRLGCAAREWIRARHSVERMVGAYRTLFADLAAGRGIAPDRIGAAAS